ncbi:hypothetical protein GCM10009738_42060 [Kitasatospora viridis]
MDPVGLADEAAAGAAGWAAIGAAGTGAEETGAGAAAFAGPAVLSAPQAVRLRPASRAGTETNIRERERMGSPRIFGTVGAVCCQG